MSVAFGSVSTPAYLSGATINITPNAPASIAAGDYLVLLLGVKPDTSVNDETITDWDFLGEFAGGGGTTGIDTGPTLIAAYGKVAVGSDSMPTINITSTNVSWAVVYRYTNATGVWDVAVAGGVDSTTGTAVSVTCGSDPGLTAGDHYIVGFCIPTDVTTPAQFSAEGVTATGVSAWGTVTEDTEPDTNVGNDIGGVTFRGSVTTGTSTAAPVIAATAGGTTTNVRGPAILVRLREAGDTPVTLPAESGSGTDAVSVAATAQLDDPRTVADALAATATVPAQADTAHGTDALTVAPAVPLADPRTVADALGAPSATVPLADPRTVVDALALTATTTLPAESGTGTDALTVAVTVALPGDTGTGTDALALTATVPLAETGTGTDGITVDTGSTNKSLTETGTGTDAATVVATTTMAESAAATDSLSVVVATTVGDLASAADTLVAQVSAFLAETTSVADLLTATPVSSTPSGRAGSGPGGPGARSGPRAAATAGSGPSGPRGGGSSTTGARARSGPNGPHAGGAS